MYWLILLGVFIIVPVIVKISTRQLELYWSRLLVCLLVCFIVLFLVTGLVLGVFVDGDTYHNLKYVVHSEKELYAFNYNTSSSFSGSFFLGCGSVTGGEDNYYSYIVEDTEIAGTKCVKTKKIRVCKIKESSSARPKLIIYNSKWPEKKYGKKWWGFGKGGGNYRYVFVIPENSVNYNYSVDLQK